MVERPCSQRAALPPDYEFRHSQSHNHEPNSQIRRHGSPKVRYAMAERLSDGMKAFSLENHAARKTLHHFSETIPFTYAK
jgi:hypothetical protein